jgi:iron(III) transport system permease protein
LAGIKKWEHPGWKSITMLLILVLVLPVSFIVIRFLSVDHADWGTLSSTLLPLYISNTSYLVCGAILVTLAIGVSTAWVVTLYDFPLKKQFEWMLILPLAIPTYINAIAYVGLTDYAGPIRILLRCLGWDIYLDLMDSNGAVFVMSLVLYPYVYIASRAAFLLQSASLIEVSRSLGKSMSATFTKVVLPLAWPAIFSGLILVVMEVLNDYGVVQYYGVPTFTTGIFRSWLSLGNLPQAIFLSFLTLAVVLLLLLAQVMIQGSTKYANEKEDRKLHARTPRYPWALTIICLVPLLFGFVVPLFQLFWWAVKVTEFESWTASIKLVSNTALLGAMAASLVVMISVILTYTFRISRFSGYAKTILRLPMIGYAIPGAVIAIGIVSMIVWINPDWIYFGITALVFGYLVRFFAVGFGTMETGFEKIPGQLDLAAASLGKTTLPRLFQIHLPLLKPVIIGAFIMVFVDVAKELPLTLILRPFNFETLATNAFQYAKDEMAPRSAPSSLLIIFVSALPVYFLNKLLPDSASG